VARLEHLAWYARVTPRLLAMRLAVPRTTSFGFQRSGCPGNACGTSNEAPELAATCGAQFHQPAGTNQEGVLAPQASMNGSRPVSSWGDSHLEHAGVDSSETIDGTECEAAHHRKRYVHAPRSTRSPKWDLLSRLHRRKTPRSFPLPLVVHVKSDSAWFFLTRPEMGGAGLSISSPPCRTGKRNEHHLRCGSALPGTSCSFGAQG